MRSGLAKNTRLEELSLCNMVPSDDDGAISACNALSFLRTNSTLKSLKVSFEETQKTFYVSAFRLEGVKMMEENSSLESLRISISSKGGKIKVKELFTLVSALQRDTTLKTLGFQLESVLFTKLSFDLTDDEVNQLVSILMKNCGLEHLAPKISCADDRTVKAILRLNSAGHRSKTDLPSQKVSTY
jgi:hypothetical protein